ncbi:MAG TPA: DegV family protein [Gemmatimonadales bacterium]|nr:DegV family protein [Gemmatimonadales bacterium]
MAAARDELNRINVFPVPDGDTGTNMCLTLRAVAGAVRNLGDGSDGGLPLPHVAETMAQASVRGARGNSGMMLSQFLLGFREGIGERLRISTRELAAAIGIGFERLSASLDEPMEGTILTVARATAEEAGRAGAESDIRVFMRRIVMRAEESLARTPDLLAVLKNAGVVDAGAKGFVRFLDGVKRLIEEGQIAEGAVDRVVESANAAALTEVEADRDYRYCTELMVRSPALPDPAAVRQALRAHGGSIVVLATGDLLKAHVHTDAPEAVFQLAGTWGTLESTKADDMRAQHQALQARRPIAFVSDTACDLPDELVLQYDIGLVPMQLIVDDHAYRDRLELTAAEFFTRMRAGLDASTSQPAPQAFADAYQDAARSGDHVIAVTVSSGLSGTNANAVAAAKRFDSTGGRLTVVDSRSASLGQGLLVVRGVELAAAAWQPAAIVRELERTRAQSGGFFTVDNYERLVRSGRLGRGRAWLGTKLNLKPVMSLTIEGKIEPVARARGREGARKRLLELLDQALTPRPNALRLGVVHGDIPEFAESLRAELVARYRPMQCLVTPITPVIAAHAGIGAWGVFYQNEDGTK